MSVNRSIKQVYAALGALEESTGGLDALAAARRVRTRAEALERDLVKATRKSGHSWADIGALYGMTKQGAQQRFRSERRSAANDATTSTTTSTSTSKATSP